MNSFFCSEIAKKLQEVIRQNIRNQVHGVSKDVKSVLDVLDDVGGNLGGLSDSLGDTGTWCLIRLTSSRA